MVKLAAYAETFPLNRIEWGERHLGVVTSGVAYQYAREVFPKASFLKLIMTFPLPENLLRYFAEQVDKLIVIEDSSHGNKDYRKGVHPQIGRIKFRHC